MTEYEQQSLTRLGQSIQSGKWSNDGLVQIIELIRPFLNPMTISEYAKQSNKTYNGIKKTKKTTYIWGKKFIIDNL
jgi:hypothetical protein